VATEDVSGDGEDEAPEASQGAIGALEDLVVEEREEDLLGYVLGLGRVEAAEPGKLDDRWAIANHELGLGRLSAYAGLADDRPDGGRKVSHATSLQ
jgi:hypothetical protein